MVGWLVGGWVGGWVVYLVGCELEDEAALGRERVFGRGGQRVPVLVLELHHVLQPPVPMNVVENPRRRRKDLVSLLGGERQLPPPHHRFPESFQGVDGGALGHQGLGVGNHHLFGLRGEHGCVYLVCMDQDKVRSLLYAEGLATHPPTHPPTHSRTSFSSMNLRQHRSSCHSNKTSSGGRYMSRSQPGGVYLVWPRLVAARGRREEEEEEEEEDGGRMDDGRRKAVAVLARPRRRRRRAPRTGAAGAAVAGALLLAVPMAVWLVCGGAAARGLLACCIKSWWGRASGDEKRGWEGPSDLALAHQHKHALLVHELSVLPVVLPVPKG